MRWLSVVAAIVTVVFVAPNAEASVEFDFEELLPASGDPSARLWAVNEAGQVVGSSQSKSHPSDAVLWDGPANPKYVGNNAALGVNGRGDAVTSSVFKSAGALIYRLGAWENGKVVDRTPDGGTTIPISARDINDAGVIPVGYRNRDDLGGSGNSRAAAWRNGKLVDLPLRAGSDVEHRVVNEKGSTAGSLTPTDNSGNYAFRCSAGKCARLAAAGSGGRYLVKALNESDAVAGSWSPDRPYASRAVVWNGTAATVLPGDYAGVAENPRAINERGDVVGWYEVDGVRKPALWRGGQLVDLGATGTGEAVAVNDRGDVVGWQRTSTGTRPFHWRAGVLTELRTPTDLESQAVGLNNAGVIIAHSGDLQTFSRAFRWTIRS